MEWLDSKAAYENITRPDMFQYTRSIPVALIFYRGNKDFSIKIEKSTTTVECSINRLRGLWKAVAILFTKMIFLYGVVSYAPSF